MILHHFKLSRQSQLNSLQTSPPRLVPTKLVNCSQSPHSGQIPQRGFILAPVRACYNRYISRKVERLASQRTSHHIYTDSSDTPFVVCREGFQPPQDGSLNFTSAPIALQVTHGTLLVQFNSCLFIPFRVSNFVYLRSVSEYDGVFCFWMGLHDTLQQPNKLFQQHKYLYLRFTTFTIRGLLTLYGTSSRLLFNR